MGSTDLRPQTRFDEDEASSCVSPPFPPPLCPIRPLLTYPLDPAATPPPCPPPPSKPPPAQPCCSNCTPPPPPPRTTHKLTPPSKFNQNMLSVVMYLPPSTPTAARILCRWADRDGSPAYASRGLHELRIKRRGCALKLERWSVERRRPEGWLVLYFKGWESEFVFCLWPPPPLFLLCMGGGVVRAVDCVLMDGRNGTLPRRLRGA